MTHDDAGKPVVLLNPVGFCDWPLRGDARVGMLIQRVRGATPRSAWRVVMMWAGLNVVWLACVYAVWKTVRLLLPGGANVVAFAAVVGVMAVLGRRILWRQLLWAKRDEGKRLVLSEALCASCGYNLHGLGPGSDGLVVCPECGAAWHAWRIRRTAPFAPGSEMGNPLPRIGGALSMWTWATRDDRGERAALVHPRLVGLRASGPGTPGWAQRLRSARDAIVGANALVRAITVGGVWCVALGVAALVGSLWMDPVRNGSLALVFASVVSAGMIAVACWAVYGNFCYSAKSVRAAMLSQGLCPSCGAELERGLVAADGCVVCACCRAGWRGGEARSEAESVEGVGSQ